MQNINPAFYIHYGTPKLTLKAYGRLVFVRGRETPTETLKHMLKGHELAWVKAYYKYIIKDQLWQKLLALSLI